MYMKLIVITSSYVDPVAPVDYYYDFSSSNSSSSTTFKLLMVSNIYICTNLIFDNALFGLKGKNISPLSMIASVIVLAFFVNFNGGRYFSSLPFIQFHSLSWWILCFPSSERPSCRWYWPVISFHPCFHRRLLAALCLEHRGLGKTILSHIIVKIMVKIVAKVMDNFLIFWEGVFYD